MYETAGMSAHGRLVARPSMVNVVVPDAGVSWMHAKDSQRMRVWLVRSAELDV
jgi:hypothetical protein